MTYSTLNSLIADSTSDSWINTDSVGIYTLKSDLNITIREIRDSEDEQDFTEEWAQRVPDKKAKKICFDLYYGASLVRRFYLVAVDGYRAYLPIPELTTLEIPRDKYYLARAVDHQGSLDEYIARCGLKVR